MPRELLSAAFWQAQLATPSAELLVKITLLLIAALAMSLALRGVTAGVRHLLWATTIAALLALPALSVASPWRVEVLPVALSPRGGAADDQRALRGEHGTRGEAEVDASARADTREHSEASAAVGAAGDSGVPGAWRPSVPMVLLLLWGLVSLGLFARLVVGWVLVRRIARTGEELIRPDWTTPLWEAADRLDLADVPRLIRSDRAALPFACGVRRPMIVLPPESEEWSEERRRAVLFHELAHVRRRDLLAHTLGRIACALYWPHPLVWSAARRLRAESERACDDLVLATGTRASDYADHLLQIVTSARHSRAPAVALPMAQRREFEGRMLAILDPRERRRLPRVQGMAVAGSVLLVAVLLAASAPAQRVVDEYAGEPDELAGYAAVDDAEATYDRPGSARALVSDGDGPVEARRADESRPLALDASIGAGANAAARVGERTAEATAEALASPGGIADFASGVAQITTDVTFDVLRQIGIEVGGSAAQRSRDEGESAREVALLVRLLGSHEDPTVRRTAAWALQRVSGAEASAALRSALLNDTGDEVRETAAWALGSRRDARHADALAAAAASDPDGEVRTTAAWALGNMRARSHADALGPALAHHDADTRMTAAWAIGQMKPDRAPARLIALLNDRSDRVQEAAAWALGEIRDPAAVPALMRALDASPGKGPRNAIVRAIVLTSARNPDALAQLAESPHADLQERAIRAMVSRGESWPWPWPWPRPRPAP